MNRSDLLFRLGSLALLTGCNSGGAMLGPTQRSSSALVKAPEPTLAPLKPHPQAALLDKDLTPSQAALLYSLGCPEFSYGGVTWNTLTGKRSGPNVDPCGNCNPPPPDPTPPPGIPGGGNTQGYPYIGGVVANAIYYPVTGWGSFQAAIFTGNEGTGPYGTFYELAQMGWGVFYKTDPGKGWACTADLAGAGKSAFNMAKNIIASAKNFTQNIVDSSENALGEWGEAAPEAEEGAAYIAAVAAAASAPEWGFAAAAGGLTFAVAMGILYCAKHT